MNGLYARLVSAVTAYDRAEEAKAKAKGGYYNRFALPQLLHRAADVAEDVERGAPPRAAVLAAFHGRLLAAVLKGIGEPRLTADEREAVSRRTVYQPVTGA